MTIADYVINILLKYEVTDTFGIPGGVILRLLDSMNNAKPELTPHLCYHEQMAGFAACGYAQYSGKLGVAYATRGPGILNMVTCIAEAYQESIPVLFITAHGSRSHSNMRFEYNQEVDVVDMCKDITKCAVNIETKDEAISIFEKVIKCSLNGRKGPVLVDFYSPVLGADVESVRCVGEEKNENYKQENDDIYDDIREQLEEAHRPVVLIGDGVRHVVNRDNILGFCEDNNIPILSSRGSQDIFSNSQMYYGYIGSHGIRYANSILAKADLVISIANRLAFNVKSKSFAPVFDNKKVIRMDVDRGEFYREIPNCVNYLLDISSVDFQKLNLNIEGAFDDWLNVCRNIKSKLIKADYVQPVSEVSELLDSLKEKDIVYVCDVGNNEFWFSRAFELIHPRGTVLCSKSFGTLGVSLGRAIGAYYASLKAVVCVVGDQGFQYNIQELQYISRWKLPITVVVINNKTSGMIRDHEEKVIKKQIHVSEATGYEPCKISKIADAYNIKFVENRMNLNIDENQIYEIDVNSDIELTPFLPKGEDIQNMHPVLNAE